MAFVWCLPAYFDNVQGHAYVCHVAWNDDGEPVGEYVTLLPDRFVTSLGGYGTELLIIALIGFSRVYSCARFPHQILASYLTGCVGLALGIQLREHVPGYFPRRLVRLKHHGWGTPGILHCVR